MTRHKKMRGFTRRSFLQWAAGLSFLCPFSGLIPRAMADPLPSSGERRNGSIAESFNGEELTYEIGFWLFKRAALGRLSFKGTGEKGRYMGVLETETMGILGFVSRYRVDTYRSIMEEVEGGGCLRSLSFEEDVKIGDKFRKNIHQFDYARRRWVKWKQAKDGSLQKTEEEIPPGKVYDDFLTAFYNFRYGVYGSIERGNRYIIPTFPRKGSSSYEVRVASREEEEKQRRSEKIKDQKDFFIKFSMDPEITYSKKGNIEGWLSKDIFPIEGTLKDALLFGDVKGTLIKNNKHS
jgi:hypothetical protein